MIFGEFSRSAYAQSALARQGDRGAEIVAHASSQSVNDVPNLPQTSNLYRNLIGRYGNLEGSRDRPDQL